MIIKPFPGGQEELLSSTEFEILFGGETKPGKTWGLVIDALGLNFETTPLGCAAIEVPSYRGVIFRRESNQLVQILDEMHKYYPDFGGKFHQKRIGDPGACYIFPSGATIFACHMKDEKDKSNHQGIDYQYIGFDELPHFLWSQFSYLFSRAVQKVKYLYPRIRSTANPEGANLIWVRERYVEVLEENESAYFLPTGLQGKEHVGIKLSPEELDKFKKGEKIIRGTQEIVYNPKRPPKSRRYIPGYLEENETIVDKEGYRAGIEMMGKRYADALIRRDWFAFSGTFFEDFDLSMVVKPFEIPKEWTLSASMDPGFSSPLSFSIRAKDFEGNIYRVLTYYEAKRSASEHAAAIRELIDNCKWTNGRKPSVIYCGKDAWAHKDKYSVTASDVTMADVFADYGLYLTPAVTDRKPGWWAMKSAMKDRKYFVFDILNKPLIMELQAAVYDDKDIEDIKGKGNDPNVSDHALDDDRYGIIGAYTPSKPYVERKLSDREASIERTITPKNDDMMSDF